MDQPSAPPVVMKFGGSSVATDAQLREVARFVCERARAEPVVVVVSARGKTTDELVEHATQLCAPPHARELDMLLTTGERHSMAMLALAIAGLGHEVVSLTGSQCGIITNHQHGRARIVEVRPFRIVDELAAGKIVVVGGFQGVSYRREITTLGRGGSDTTAVALAAALGGDCEIYSDVDGVYSSDPRTLRSARRLDELDPESMQALSRAGAKVLHAHAVQIAQDADVVVYARRTGDGEGSGQTIIRKGPKPERGVKAVATIEPVVSLSLTLVSRGGEFGAELAARLGGLGLKYLSVRPDGADGLAHGDECEAIEGAFAQLVADWTEREDVLIDEVHSRGGLGLVTCVGPSLEDRGELMTEALAVLASAHIGVRGMHTDSHSVGFVLDAARTGQAAALLHDALLG